MTVKPSAVETASNSKKSIIIIGSGMGGLAAGIYGQLSGFRTIICEAHHLPGGQCTSWQREGYVFDACLHNLNGFKPNTKINAFWKELGALPCDTIERKEFISAVSPEGTYFHNYFDVDKLESHLKELSPEDTAVIDEYIQGIRAFSKEIDWFGISNLGSFWEKLSTLPFFLGKLKYFKHSLGSFALKFKHPLLRKAFPLFHSSIPDVPLFGYLAEHGSSVIGDITWPEGGGFTLSKNMARRYQELGGTIQYRKRTVKILTENNRAYGVELADGTRLEGDFVVSNADGRKTILHMLDGQYMNNKVRRYCEPFPDDRDVPSAVMVFLGLNRDLSTYPSSLVLFLDKPEIIGGTSCDHLHMQIYGFDHSMAPKGKGVIKIELFGKPSYFKNLYSNKEAYKAEKKKVADQVIHLLDKQFPSLRADIDVVDICTLCTWERFMGGSQGYNNFPKKYKELTDIRNTLDFIFGLNRMYSLPGLKNFFFTGQWVTSMGSLFSNALTGKTVVEKIRRQCGMDVS